MSDDEASVNLVSAAQKNIVTTYVNDFTEESYKEFRESILKAERTGQTIIPIIVDSHGGDVDALFAMLDLIKSAKIPVATIGVGKAMSAGSVLVSSGTKGMRYLSPLARIMVHEVSTIVFGKNSEITATAQEVDRMNEAFLRILDSNCEKQVGYWKSHLKEVKNANLFLTAEQSKDHGLIDIIGTPRILADVKVKTKLV